MKASGDLQYPSTQGRGIEEGKVSLHAVKRYVLASRIWKPSWSNFAIYSNHFEQGFNVRDCVPSMYTF